MSARHAAQEHVVPTASRTWREHEVGRVQVGECEAFEQDGASLKVREVQQHAVGRLRGVHIPKAAHAATAEVYPVGAVFEVRDRARSAENTPEVEDVGSPARL